MTPIQITYPNIIVILPELLLMCWVFFMMMADLFIPKEKKEVNALFAIVGIALSIAAIIMVMPYGDISSFNDSMRSDRFALFFKLLFCITAALTILISVRYLPIEGINWGEYYSLLLFAVSGMMVLASATDLVTIYLGMEFMALTVYVLTGFIRHDVRSNEAALKYFLLGAFSSGIILYGMVLLYGVTGSTNLYKIAGFLAANDNFSNPVMIASVILLVSGFAFKIAAVPFHMWAPDAYEGAPTPITAFMAVGPKAASFAAIIRLFLTALPVVKPHWVAVFWGLSAITMVVGNVVAVSQTNIKRMLAYSGIGHAGYILMGVVAGTKIGMAAVILYMFVYIFMSIGAFSVIIMLRKTGVRGDEIKDFSGFARRYPSLGLCMLIFLISLIGLPPTAGFIGKMYLFAAAVESEYYYLAGIGVTMSLVALYYYMGVAKTMYIDEEIAGQELVPSKALTFVVYLCAAATLLIGIFPNGFISAAMASILPI
jgi:NADH-quinone oxidoreductase subunit N